MTAQEERNNNELIAKFMEFKEVVHDGEEKEYYVPHKFGRYDCDGNWTDTATPREMEFDTSWNWVMLVVEKIESMGHATNIEYNSKILGHVCKIYVKEKHRVFGLHTHSKIEAMFAAIVQFINWYNKQQNGN